jgi:hypothetical protein
MGPNADAALMDALIWEDGQGRVNGGCYWSVAACARIHTVLLQTAWEAT